MPRGRKPKNKLDSNEENKAKRTSLNKTGITKAELSEAISKLNGNISEISKCFNLENNRSVIYKLIAKYNLITELQDARGYENNLEVLVGNLAVEINLEALLSMNPKKLSKQDVTLLIFNLKACAKWVEAVASKDDKDNNDGSINQLLDKLDQFRQKDNE